MSSVKSNNKKKLIYVRKSCECKNLANKKTIENENELEYIFNKRSNDKS